jgi:hypothetical protein
MGLLITELPQDILISIFLRLTIENILSLKQASHIFSNPSADTLNMHGQHVDVPWSACYRFRRLSLAPIRRRL